MEWRPEGWENPHLGLESETFIEQAANTLLAGAYEAGADDILQAYMSSDQFQEAACEYCREQGWKEPV